MSIHSQRSAFTLPSLSAFTLSPLSKALLVISLASSTSLASAKVLSSEDTEANMPSVTLAPIIVTAGKIERTAHDTMDSVKVTSADQMEDNPSLTDFYDVLQNTTNVSSESNYSVNIRGVNSYGTTGGGKAKTINFIVDGATQSETATYAGNLSTWDMDTFEVLRGPQSTTAGQNALAGSVVIKSKDPEFTQSGKVQLGYASDNTYQVAIADAGAITDKLAYRISAEHKHTDGHTRNEYFNTDDWNSSNTNTVRGKLLYLINDDSDIKLTLSQIKNEVDGSNNSDSPNRRVINDNSPTFFNTKTDNAILEYNNQLSDNWSLKSTTAYSKSDFDRSSDNDGPHGNSIWNEQSDSKNVSEELLVNYDNANNLKAVVGLYASKGEEDDKTQTNGFPLPTATALGGGPLPPNTAPYFTANYTDDSLVEYNNYAVFANADYKLTDNLTLLTGLRYDYDKRNHTSQPITEMATGTGNPTVDAGIKVGLSGFVGDTEGEHINKVWLPKVGLNYEWNDNLKTGVLYKRGYRPGGVSLNVVRRNVKQFEPEFTDNYELSTRFKNDADTLAIQGNLFYTNWKDQQVKVTESPMPYDAYDTNAGKSHLYGLEVDGAYQITPEVELTAGVGVVKTEFDEFVNNGVDYAGKEFENARRVTGNLGLTYRDEGWFVGGYANYKGKAWDDLANTVEIEPYTLVNLKAGYEGDHWGLYAHVNNFFDKKYVYNQWDFGAYQNYYLGEPRSVGISANYKW